MKVINIFAGPSSGKSTTAAGVYHKLKTLGKNVEYVSEYAKDLIYENRLERLNDYLYVLAEQHHRLYRLKNQVDYVICDGSFLFGYVHCSKKGIYNKKLFQQFVLDIFNQYDNTNYFLSRQKLLYQTIGRKESLKEAISLDKKLIRLFEKENILYQTIPTQKALKHIVKQVQKEDI